MKKLLVILIALINVTTLMAQKEIGSIPVSYSSDYFSDKESIAISNKNTNELAVLIEDDDKTILTLLDEQFKPTSSLNAEKLDRKFKTFIGYTIQGDDYFIFFKNNTDKKFGYIEFNFKARTVSQSLIDFKQNNEKYVEAITQNDTFYLMTAEKETSNINFYEFTQEKELLKHTVDFNFISYYYNSPNRGTIHKSPYELLTSGWGRFGSLTKIDSNSPSAIESTSDKVKLYQIDDELIFTFDNQEEKTQVLRINTTDFSKKEITFDKPKLCRKSFTVAHNSLYNNGILYQSVCSSDELIFTAKNFNDLNLLKELNITKTNDSIDFKNGPIIQENSSMWHSDNKRVRELEKSSKFLRKVSSGNLGIIAFIDNDNIIHLTIGGNIEIKGGRGMGMGMPGIPSGAIPLENPSLNPFMAAYNSYSYTKSTRIDCLFDSNFNHIEGDVEKNIFDKIHEQEKIIEKEKKLTWGLELKNIFKHNNKFYFSYFDTKDNIYRFIEFEG